MAHERRGQSGRARPTVSPGIGGARKPETADPSPGVPGGQGVRLPFLPARARPESRDIPYIATETPVPAGAPELPPPPLHAPQNPAIPEQRPEAIEQLQPPEQHWEPPAREPVQEHPLAAALDRVAKEIRSGVLPVPDASPDTSDAAALAAVLAALLQKRSV